MEALLSQLSHQEILLLGAGALLTGVISGGLAGMLGIGGGTIIVAFLYYIFGIIGVDENARMHLAVGTSLASIIPISLRSLHGHWRVGAVDAELLLRYWVVPLLIGAVLGGALNGYVPDVALRIFFALFIMILGIYMLAGSTAFRLAEALPVGGGRWLLGSLNGFISALLGIGGGALGVVAMTAFAIPIHRAVATASGFGAIIALPAVIGFIVAGWGMPALPPGSLGYVNGIGCLLIVPSALGCALAGVRIAHLLPRDALRRIFAAFLLANGCYMCFDLLTP